MIAVAAVVAGAGSAGVELAVAAGPAGSGVPAGDAAGETVAAAAVVDAFGVVVTPAVAGCRDVPHALASRAAAIDNATAGTRRDALIHRC